LHFTPSYLACRLENKFYNLLKKVNSPKNKLL
jgi:hypothetical protein